MSSSRERQKTYRLQRTLSRCATRRRHRLWTWPPPIGYIAAVDRTLHGGPTIRPSRPRPQGKRSSSRRVLITGGAGFLGSHLCDRFLDEGLEVLCVDNLLTGTIDNIAHIRSRAFTFIELDVTGYIYVE